MKETDGFLTDEGKRHSLVQGVSGGLAVGPAGLLQRQTSWSRSNKQDMFQNVPPFCLISRAEIKNAVHRGRIVPLFINIF